MKTEYTCPVMGHEITDIETASGSEYEGTTYYFCCEDCKTSFDEDPARYASNGSGEGYHDHHHHH